MQKPIFVFYCLLIFATPNVFAQSQDELILWENQSFTQPQSCELSVSQENLNSIESPMLDGVISPYFPSFSFNETLVPLNNSLWKIVSEDKALVKARCGNQDNLYIVEVTPEDPSYEYLYVALSAENLNEIDQLHRQALELKEASSRDIPSFLSDFEAFNGEFDYVVCTSSSSLNVRDDSLDKVLFQAKRYESVKEFQSFGSDEQEKVIGGKTYTFSRMQFPENSNREGWVANDFIALRSECPGAPLVSKPIDPTGWIFPTSQRPSSSYLSGARAFGARRGGGTRSHAACDLYRVRNEDVVSVTSGKVIRGLYSFYQGTYAIEVKHSDSRVARYGEITGQSVSGVKLNQYVSTGQTIGYVGKVNSGCCTPMLHFELYSGKGSGSLTTSGNKFRRRWDLLDPTSDLLNWELHTFGESY